MTTLLVVLAVVLLGLMAGALLAEACVLVPFWRKTAPESFLAWYREHAALLLHFFGPLEVAATLAILLAAGVSWLTSGPATGCLLGASVFCVLALLSFPVYFKTVNESFAKGSIELNQLPSELARWSRWHWARVALATAAFVASVLAALQLGD